VLLNSTLSTQIKIMSIGQTIKHIGTILLITLGVAAQAQQAQTYEVAGCEFLNMREGPASTYPINQRLQSGVNGIVLIGKPVFNGATKWQQVNSRGVIGWVNAYYLKESIQPKPIPTPQPTPKPTATPTPQPTATPPPIAIHTPKPTSTPAPAVAITSPTIMKYVEYFVYALCVIITSIWIFGLRTYTLRGTPPMMATINITMLFVVSLIIIPLLSLSPLHLLWMFVCSLIIGFLSIVFPFSLLSIPGQLFYIIACIGLDHEKAVKNHKKVTKVFSEINFDQEMALRTIMTEEDVTPEQARALLIERGKWYNDKN
jgi:uncharacterized protein YraI